MSYVLIIEDDTILNRMYERAFTFENVPVKTAIDGEKGMALIGEEKPFLVLLDIMMPKKSGFQLLDELKQGDDTKDIPVIVLSNLASNEDQQLALSKGAVSYVVKSGHDPRGVVKIVQDFMVERGISGVSG